MDCKLRDSKTRLELLGLIILVVGLGVSIYIDRTAVDEPADALRYEMNGQSAQPVRPEDSKKFLRDMEQYNGKAGMLMYELRTWFAGLWQGRALARTLYCLTLASTAALFIIARRLPPCSDPESSRENGKE